MERVNQKLDNIEMRHRIPRKRKRVTQTRRKEIIAQIIGLLQHCVPSQNRPRSNPDEGKHTNYLTFYRSSIR